VIAISMRIWVVIFIAMSVCSLRVDGMMLAGRPGSAEVSPAEGACDGDLSRSRRS
jgi:hypothetical protein